MTDISRRAFLDASGKIVVGAAVAGAIDFPFGFPGQPLQPSGAKLRLAAVGTGVRFTGAWARDLLREHGERVEYVGLADINPKRIESAKQLTGLTAPSFTDLGQMLRTVKPDALVVTTKDSTHDEMIVQALDAGVNVITEKPMTTDEVKAKRILDAEKRSGKRVTVAFNYRYATTASKIKELLMAGTIGKVTSVDFHWYLDNSHGADYFRRWHAYRKNSGTLWVHKSTHHFDLINWYLGADPVEVSAEGALHRYGKNGRFRGVNCRTCQHKQECEYNWDMTRNQQLMKLYAEAESVDGYYRDACVFREDIDIYDSMAATVKYNTGAIMSYSVNAFMPIEGYHLAFNGPGGRIEVRMYERQPWPTERGVDEIRVTKAFGGSEIIKSPWGQGGHYGGDPKLRTMTFVPETPDPLGQRAGSRAGAMSMLTGVAADRSIQRNQPVAIAELLPGLAD
jgi:predicted dehydrogenase